MKKLILLSLLGAFLIGCGTSNSVVNDGLFQKRKYTSGWFVKKNKGVEKKSANEENLAFKEQDVRSSKAKLTQQSNESSNTVKHTDVKNESINDTKTLKRNTTTSQQKRKVAAKSTQIVRNNLVKEAQTKTNTATERFVKEELSTSTSDQREKHSSSSSDVEIILLVLLALIIPPLAVYLVQDTSTMFVVDLILFIIGWGSFWFFSLGGLASLVAVVIALLVVFGVL